MQHLFFFCTMLIITSDAFPKDFSPFSTSVRRKNSDFAPKVNIPVDFITSSHLSKASLPHFVSKKCNEFCDCLYQKKYFNQRKRRSRKGKRSLTREKFPILESSQYHAERRFQPICCHTCYQFLNFVGERKKPYVTRSHSYVWSKNPKNRPRTFSKSSKLKNKRCAKSQKMSKGDKNGSSDFGSKMTEPSIPKVDFKYPYDPKIYDSYLRNDLVLNREFSAGDVGETSTEAVYNLAKIEPKLEDDENVLESQESEAAMNNDNMTEGNATAANDDIKTKIDVAIPILSQISEELSHKTNTTTSTSTSTATSTDKKTKFMKDMPKKDPGCSADGTWLSSSLGLEINITTQPNKMLKVTVVSAKKDGVIDKKWAIQGLTLSKHGGPLILAAVYPQKKKIASFIGQCKVCQGEDLMVGSWTISKCALKCSDLWTTVETKLDVFKRIRKEVGKKKKGT